MRCRFCDSELPARALFCGECGRAVAAVSPGVVAAAHPIVDRPLTVAAPTPEPGVSAAPDACEQCGSSLAPSDIFCGECGFVARAVSGADTVAIETSTPASASSVGSNPPIETPVSEDEPSTFILQFSTGESVSVSGSGLIGRSPRAEPGEFFDVLVRVSDASRSVSKTHLEFGQEGGEFWIRDRFSGNGTVLRGPDSPVVHVVADRRYRVPRGSRVDVGDQFFVVS
ncbi:MAG TPA: zinc ribbon domain-containing protein [Terrimesophilobacter sp.]|nr:zinc ribbon domain-containing protein [Terrimesophilobacter sp.]